jgi:predicted DNA-binding transcriptional regulator AlpA
MASLQAKELSEREIEDQYGIKARTLQGWRTRKKGPPYRKVSGTLVRYNRSEFEAWLYSSPQFLTSPSQASTADGYKERTNPTARKRRQPLEEDRAL